MLVVALEVSSLTVGSTVPILGSLSIALKMFLRIEVSMYSHIVANQNYDDSDFRCISQNNFLRYFFSYYGLSP